MDLSRRKIRFYFLSFLKHDFKASINVFLEALPLCIGIALASGVPIYSGLVAGVVGGIVVSSISKSQLTINGPATSMVIVCVTALSLLGKMDSFFAAVAIAGLYQILLGVLRFGNFSYFIPAVVVRGMMAAIGIYLIIQQFPYAIGDIDLIYAKKAEFLHFISFEKLWVHTIKLWSHLSAGVTLISMISVAILFVWEKKLSKKINYLPVYFIVVWVGIFLAWILENYFPAMALKRSQYVSIPHDVMSQVHLQNLHTLLADAHIWKVAVFICFMASLTSFVNLEAIDKMDPYNRVTPRSRELVAQGTGNILSGMLGGLPIIVLIARSTANIETGGRSKLSSFMHSIWLLVAVYFLPFLVNMIPYCALAVILIKIGYKLVNCRAIAEIYHSGRKQFLPFLVTIMAILMTDILIGVLIGMIYSFYCIIKNSYKAEFFLNEKNEGHLKHYTLKLEPSVSFLNKKGIINALDEIPGYSIVEIIGSDGGNIDYDILEVIKQYQLKAHNRHIELILKDVPGSASVPV